MGGSYITMDWERLAQRDTTEDVAAINKRLKELYGQELDGRPKFRIVWSRDELEMRIGKFTKTTPGGLYLGVEEGVKQVPKYWYLPPCWVLERLLFYDNPEVRVDKPGIYECVHAFYVGETGQPLPLEWKMCEYVVRLALSPNPRQTAADILKEEIEEEEKEKALAFEVLDNESPDTATLLHIGEGTVVPDLAGTGIDTKKLPGVKESDVNNK